jgi:hypothetical protein
VGFLTNASTALVETAGTWIWHWLNAPIHNSLHINPILIGRELQNR